MAFRFIFALALVAVASAGYAPAAQVYHGAPFAVGHNVIVKAAEEYDSHPQYRFAYGVDDKVTGDSKSQVEERDGDVVRGEYSLIDADGYKRTVHYTADDVNGFNAVVEREPLYKTVAVAPAVKYSTAPVVQYTAPVAHYSTPVEHYAGPAVATTYSSPVARYAAPAAAHYSSYATPLAYANSNAHYSTYSSPAVAYHH